MLQEIKTINVGGVNCFLIKTDTGFVLIDTGVLNNPTKLEKELENAGCKPGNLKLIILTHGDFDHSGNAAYVRKKFGAKIAMHIGDTGKVEHGDQTWGNKAKPDRFTAFGKLLSFMSRFFVKSQELDPFKPDLTIDEAFDLSAYGLDARILYLPGHTSGSIGILTTSGDLFCGDLFMNMIKPDIHFLIDDLAAANISVEKLKKLNVKTVYPGHGKPFSWEQLLKNNKQRED